MQGLFITTGNVKITECLHRLEFGYHQYIQSLFILKKYPDAYQYSIF